MYVNKRTTSADYSNADRIHSTKKENQPEDLMQRTIGYEPRETGCRSHFLSRKSCVVMFADGKSFLFDSAGRGEEFRAKPANHRPPDLTLGSFLFSSETMRNYFVRDFSST
ncbi:MAG TPA: hypothetical protein DIT29_05150 [Pseudothermotoga sp.]|nr:hypothetical protein [Pseudothermotoga sp.]HCO98095.1 hypothetical protein [Pseudothermotoga sp.]